MGKEYESNLEGNRGMNHQRSQGDGKETLSKMHVGLYLEHAAESSIVQGEPQSEEEDSAPRHGNCRIPEDQIGRAGAMPEFLLDESFLSVLLSGHENLIQTAR